ncbi:MAG: hypothetical protein V1744_00810 [Candidatus Altiarchaeota archaeon]
MEKLRAGGADSSIVLRKGMLKPGEYEPFDIPTFIEANTLSIRGLYCPELGRNVNLDLKDQIVLFCQGDSTEDTMTHAFGDLSIPDVIKKFRVKNRLDAVIVCNPGGCKLPEDLIYLSKSRGSSPETILISNEEGLHVVVPNFSGIVSDIHLPERILSEQR